MVFAVAAFMHDSMNCYCRSNFYLKFGILNLEFGIFCSFILFLYSRRVFSLFIQICQFEWYLRFVSLFKSNFVQIIFICFDGSLSVLLFKSYNYPFVGESVKKGMRNINSFCGWKWTQPNRVTLLTKKKKERKTVQRNPIFHFAQPKRKWWTNEILTMS